MLSKGLIYLAIMFASIAPAGAQTVEIAETPIALKETATPGFFSLTADLTRRSKLYFGLEETGTVGVYGELHKFTLNPTGTVTTSGRGAVFSLEIAAGNTQTFSGLQRGVEVATSHRGTGSIGTLNSIYGITQIVGGGTVTDAYGMYGYTYVDPEGSNAQTVTRAYGVRGTVQNSGLNTTTIGTAYAGYFNVANFSSSGFINTAVGVYVQTDSLDAETNETYGVYVGPLQGVTQWGIYNDDDDAPNWSDAPTYSAGYAETFATKTTTYTVTANDSFFACDATAGAVTFDLPTAASACKTAGGYTMCRSYVLKKIDASGNACLFDGNGAETIDGAATATTSTQWASIEIISTGTAWLKK